MNVLHLTRNKQLNENVIRAEKEVCSVLHMVKINSLK